ncbi:MAG TPA: ChbG/HpnK family deacetylase [Solirubrobacterales bacterium]|nr:ChbG/HpnK family deacetylase [Solirubrobacterales bacterium]
MADERFLIVNADDLGMTAAVNDGIFETHEHGIVTSASLMVGRPAAPAAAAALAAHPDLAVGLHLEAAFVLGTDMPVQGRTPDVECRKQLERFRALVGRDPTHLDSHKHVHELDKAFGAAAEALAAELEVPLRNRGIRYERRFYGRDAISPGHLIRLIEELPPGWTEIGCHPAAGPVPSSSYDAERQIELATLRHPRVKNLLNVTSVQLCSFAQANPC